MNVAHLLTDDDAVSPVIGVILMVAITVILAAIIGVYALNANSTKPAQPTVNWEPETNTSGSGVTADFGHGGGDTVERPTEILEFHPEGHDPAQPVHADADGDGYLDTNEHLFSDAYDASDGTEVDLVWVENDDSSTVIATHTIRT